MSIRRAPRPESNFYLLDKQISEDGKLSWAARGMLVFLLGKPDHWEVSTAHLIKQTEGASKQSGRDAVRAILKELIDCGYITRVAARKEGGEFGGYDYIVSEIPRPESPATDSPKTDNPAPANPPQVSIEDQARNESKQQVRSTAKKPAANHASDQQFESAWKQYPKREGSNPKNHALSAWKARIAEGHSADVMMAGLQRYLAYCQARGQIGTAFVMQAKRFFGTSLEFANDWEVSPRQGRADGGMVDPNDTSWIHDDWGY